MKNKMSKRLLSVAFASLLLFQSAGLQSDSFLPKAEAATDETATIEYVNKLPVKTGGDVNLDGTVNAADAVMLQDYLTGGASLTTEQVSPADCNADSTLNGFDLAVLKRMMHNGDWYAESVDVESTVSVDVGTDKVVDSIEFTLDTSTDYTLHISVGFWAAWTNIQCADGTLTQIEDSDNVESVTIDGNKVTIQLSEEIYASANPDNTTQAQYLGKVMFHHNSGDAPINITSYSIGLADPPPIDYALTVEPESTMQIDVGTDKALDTIELVLDTTNNYTLHVNVGFWAAWANIQCANGTLTQVEDSQNVDNVTIDGNKVTIKLSAGVYASANASNTSQAPYLGKVTLHHNEGDAAINVISYNIKYVEVKTPDGINIDDLLDMSELEGWATVEGDGLKTTTGGAGGEVVLVTTLSEFTAVSSDDTPRIIVVDGLIECGDSAIRIGSNKTIVGADADAEIKGGLYITSESNIIVANLTIDAEYPDGSVVDCFAARNVHHLWVTHVTAHDASDGLLDLTVGSNYITVSWCKFYYDDTSNGHRLACLDSNGTSAGETDTGRNKVTYHHNWWAHGCDQRMPRILFGQGHVYNNYYSAEGNSYCIGVGSYASVLVEGNYFKNVKDPHEFMYTHALPAYITARDNVYDNTSGNRHSGLGGGEFGNVDPFTDPPYDYTLDDANDIPSIVQNGAGPQ